MQKGVIILAAGKGKRMASNLPKVLHKVGGKPMVKHLTALAAQLGDTPPIVIYGHEGEKIQSALSDEQVTWVEQVDQLGTGHAVLQALPHFDDERLYFILVGDAPLIRYETLSQLSAAAEDTGIAVLTVHLDNPFGYGRIVRHENQQVKKIIEEKDADTDEQAIQEINSGVFAIRGSLLKNLLPQLNNNNVQKEYYLTDIVALANAAGHPVIPHQINDASEVLGCNNKVQLAQLERAYQQRQAKQLLESGVTLLDPNRIDIRGQLTAGKDCSIDINCIFEGEVFLGNNVTIEPNCILRNTQIGSGTTIKANTVIEEAIIGDEADIGPFARIRPKTVLAGQTKIGNFVETKNVKIATGSKVNHLSYIGDADIGERVNVGAGTITCNYDGANKHKTTIKAGAFIGSNTALVAPVTVGKNATVAAGSTITKDVMDESLGITRSRQSCIENWLRPVKKNQKE